MWCERITCIYLYTELCYFTFSFALRKLVRLKNKTSSFNRNIFQCSDNVFHFFRITLLSAAAAAPLSSFLDWPGGGLLAALAEDDDGICAPTRNVDLEDVVTDRRRFIVAWVTDLFVGLTSVLRFRGWTTPILGLARVIGAGLVTGLRDLVRATFTPPRLVTGVDVAAALVVVRRAAALAELADDDSESQLDTDVLARDDFTREGTPVVGFVTKNRLTWQIWQQI